MSDARPPKALGVEGRRLWRLVAAGVDFEAHELAHLEAACRLHDRAAALDAEVDRDGLMVAGSRGQQVLHPAAQEARQCRAEVARLLAKVAWPDEAGNASAAGRRLRAARKAG